MAGAASGVAMGRRTRASQRERKVLFYTFQFSPPPALSLTTGYPLLYRTLPLC